MWAMLIRRECDMIKSVQTGSILDVHGIEKGFAMIAAAGFEGVDFNLDHLLSGRDIVNGKLMGFFDQTDAEMCEFIRPYKEAAESCGVSFAQAHAPFPSWVDNASTNAYVIHAIKKTIMLCDYVGCRNLVVHPAIITGDPALEREENLKLYTALIPELKRYRVTCCLENMFSAYRGKLTEAVCSDPHEAADYIDELNARAGERVFGFCLDTGHATLLGKDLRRFIETLGDRLTVTHVHDNNGLDDEHLFPYMGITDWDRFCRALGETGYDGPLSFETFNALNTFDTALAPQLMSLLGATADLLAGRIEGARKGDMA